MRYNTKLAIAIPTYNRVSILRENIYFMMDEIRRFSIPVYISDDSNNDDTELLVKELREKYTNIHYSKNIPSLGHDKNCIKTLGLPVEDYVWYLGDSLIIDHNGIIRVLEIINGGDYDFISVNTGGRVNLKEQIFSDCNELLAQLGWHITLTGVTIYSKKALKFINTLDLTKCRNFPQTAIILNQFANGNKQLYWINDDLVYSNNRKKSYWKPNIFNVFLSDWDYFITNLPGEYKESNKKYTIKLHARKTGLFTLISFLSYRADGYYNWQILTKYKEQIKDNTDICYCLLLIIAVFPKKVLRIFRKILKQII